MTLIPNTILLATRRGDDDSALQIAAKLLERLEMSTAMVLEFDEDFASSVRCQQNLARLPAWIDEALTYRCGERLPDLAPPSA